MHEDTIFKISGSIDFYDMLMLEKLDEKQEDWKFSEIPTVENGEKVQEIIMNDHFFQEKPLKITGFSGDVYVRKDYDFEQDIQAKQQDSNHTFLFKDFRHLDRGATRFPYKYLREQNEGTEQSTNKKSSTQSPSYFIYDEQILPEEKQNSEKEEEQSNDETTIKPFDELFKVSSIIYGESLLPFYTKPAEQTVQKIICNIGLNDTKDELVGNLNVSVVNHLFLRYLYLTNRFTDDNSAISELDLFNTDKDYGKSRSFDYSMINQVTLKPGDCLYLPANWWLQLHNRMDLKLSGQKSPLFENNLPDEEIPTNVRWVEYKYAL